MIEKNDGPLRCTHVPNDLWSCTQRQPVVHSGFGSNSCGHATERSHPLQALFRQHVAEGVIPTRASKAAYLLSKHYLLASTTCEGR
jgi:hypothetical protein